MKVAKWGNSLAVRLPAALVEKLNLKEGDEVNLAVGAGGELEVSPDLDRQRILKRIRSLRVPLPPGFKFNREEAHERGHRDVVETSEPGTAADQ